MDERQALLNDVSDAHRAECPPTAIEANAVSRLPVLTCLIIRSPLSLPIENLKN